MQFTSALLLALLVATQPHPAGSPTAPEPLPPETPLAQAEDTEPKWAVLPLKGGRIEVLKGTRVLYLEGSIEERGFAEGYLLGAEIEECFGEFALGHVVGGRPQLWDLLVRPGIRARFGFDEETRRWAAALVVGMELAAGGGVKLEGLGRDLEAEDILACAAIPDLAGFLCSSVAAWGKGTTTGDLIVARNLDYPSTPAIERHSMVEVHAPLEGADGKTRAGWIGVGWPGTAGCLTGLSDRGVFVAIHDVDVNGKKPPGKATPRAMALQDLVETLEPSPTTPEDAARTLREHRFVMGGNCMLAWEGQSQPGHAISQGAVVLEMGIDQARDEGTTLRSPKAGEPFISCSNHFRLRAKDDLHCDRFDTLDEGARAERLSEARAWKLIDDAGMSITLYRCVAHPGEGRIVVQRHTEKGWQPTVEFTPWR